MILITGGLGFVGSNTAEALAKLGERCVLVQRSQHDIPTFLIDYIGDTVFIESADVGDLDAMLKLGETYTFTGIIHLAASVSRKPFGLPDDIRSNMGHLANILELSKQWNIKRLLVASSLGVYGTSTAVPWREDQPLSLDATFSIQAFKKAEEVFVSCAANGGMEAISIRLAGMYGPMYEPTKRVLAGRLVHAAVTGTKPDLTGVIGSAYADDGYDQCYIKDVARGIALLQTAAKLNHQVYNVASGHPTTNQHIVDAIHAVVPEAQLELPAGHAPGAAEAVGYQSIDWLREDTGYEPLFTPKSAVADYIDWLRAGNAK